MFFLDSAAHQVQRRAEEYDHMKQRFPISEEALLAVDDALASPPGPHENLNR